MDIQITVAEIVQMLCALMIGLLLSSLFFKQGDGNESDDDDIPF